MISSRQRRPALISLLLLVLMARALVPVGFMPAADRSAQLILCPDGMLMPAHDGSGAPAFGQSHLHADHCPFGAAPFAAPLSHVPVHPVLADAIRPFACVPAPWIAGTRASRAHQPRAPPA